MDEERADVDVTVRTLSEKDFERLVRIDEQITGRRRTEWYQGKLKRALQDSDVHISLGAEVDGTLVGALFGSVFFGEYGQPEPVAVLDTVLVDREVKRRGIGRALFEQLQLNLRALHIEKLRTEVAWDQHELVQFFASRGFKPAERLVLECKL
ncbi:MAG: GNAT family N-acetyltransferase [Deltaproteobacteria bacterium]|nr:GNAT family N-acetyltransferase [Deltaproteobacteria bacterium]